MEKLYNNARDRQVKIYCKRYNRIYLPKLVFNLMRDNCKDSIDTVDIYIDNKQIKVVPNPTGEFAVCHNGSSPHGRNIALNRTAIKYYGVTEGNYPCDVDENGTLTIKLERIEKC